MFVAVPFVSQFGTGFLDEEPFKVHNSLSSESFKCRNFVCAKVDIDISSEDLVCYPTGALLQRQLESITLCGLIIKDLRAVHTEWVCVAVTLFNRSDKVLLDGELFKVHNNLTPESFKCSIVACAKVTSNNHLNGA